MSCRWQKIWLTILFAVSFGLLEAIVVIYLRKLVGSEMTLISPKISMSDTIFSLGFISFLKPSASILITGSQKLLSLELYREFSTLVMLVSLAVIAGRTAREKFSFFLLAFGVWDIFYYVFLKIIIDLPISLFEPDIFFLIPVAWVGPVTTPLLISSIMVISAILILLGVIEDV